MIALIVKKFGGVLLAAGLVAGAVLADSAHSTARAASDNDYPSMTIRAADDIADSHPTTKALLRWKELLDKATGGKIKMQVFPNAVLGSTDSQMTQLQEGSLDIVVLGGVSLLGKYNPEANIELLPFMFQSNQAAMKALDGPYGKWLAEKIVEPAGFKVMSYMVNGLRHLGNTKRPITKPEDMSGLKFRVANVELLLEFFKQVGATAVPMPFTEVFTALQQGTVDGFENPAAVFNSNHFDEVTKYLSLTGHAFTAYVPVMDLKKFNSYPANVQKVLLDTAQEASLYQRNLMYKYEDDSVAKLKAAGMKVNEVDKDAFVKAVKPIWDRFTAKYGDEGIKLAIGSQK
jgi:tripartite ATP-independent transporter DctP family solute receptor